MYLSWQSRTRTDIFLSNNQTLSRLSYLPSNALPTWLHRIEVGAGTGIEPAFIFDAAYETAVHASAHPRTRAAAAGLEPAHSRIPSERSEARLSYAAKDEVRRGLMDWGKLELTPNSL